MSSNILREAIDAVVRRILAPARHQMTRQSIIETLESRQLLSTVAINFQATTTTDTPSGYLADTGATFASRGNGYSYGWSASNSANMRDRNALNSFDNRYDTVAFMNGATTWKIALTPNTNYQVRVVAGDPGATSSNLNTLANGATVIPSFVAGNVNNWADRSAIVSSGSTGEIVISNGTAASNNRLQFIEFTPASELSAPTAVPTNLNVVAANYYSADILWDYTPASGEKVTGFKVERKWTGSGADNLWREAGIVGADQHYFNDTRSGSDTWQLWANKSFVYRVSAYNSAGSSSTSSEASITTPNTTSGSYQAPFNNARSAWSIDSKIEAENFDTGGQGVSYNDSNTSNTGYVYRNGGVDVTWAAESSQANRGYMIAWTAAGEWTKYTVNVPTTGTYLLEAKVSYHTAGGTFHVEFDGVDKTGALTIPNTSDWHQFQTISVPVTLSAGTQTMSIKLDTIGSGGHTGNLDWLQFTKVPAAPTSPSATAGASSQINLSWTASSAATGYNVYRGTTTGGESSTPINSSPITGTSFSDTGLNPNTTYYYIVKAVNGSAFSAASAEVIATTPSAVPAAPSNFAGSAISPTSANLTWTDNSNNETGFLLWTYSGGEWIQMLGKSFSANSTSGTLDDLEPNTEYQLKLSAFNAAGSSGLSNEIIITTPSSTPTVPYAPSAMTAVASSASTIHLMWTDNSDNEYGFIIYRSEDNGQTFSIVGSTEANATEYDDGNTSPAINYIYHVVSEGVAGTSVPSNASNSVSPITPPTDPTALVAYPTGEVGLIIVWADNSNDEDGYKVELSIEGGDFETVGVTEEFDNYVNSGYLELPNFNMNRTNVDVTFRVSGFRDNVFSNPIFFSLTPKPVQLFGQGITSPGAGLIITQTSVRLEWQPSAGDSFETRYTIERSSDQGNTWSQAAEISYNGSHRQLWTDNGLTEGTQYSYRIFSHRKNSVSNPSDIITFATLPNEASNLTATWIGPTQLRLSWQDNSNGEAGFEVNGLWRFAPNTTTADISFPYGGSGVSTFYLKTLGQSLNYASPNGIAVQASNRPSAPQPPNGVYHQNFALIESGSHDIMEGDSSTIRIRRTVAPGRSVGSTIVPIVLAGGATNSDFDGLPSSLTFDAYDNSASLVNFTQDIDIPLNATVDGTRESTEYFSLIIPPSSEFAGQAVSELYRIYDVNALELFARRTGGRFGAVVSNDIKLSGDPTKYLILANNDQEESSIEVADFDNDEIVLPPHTTGIDYSLLERDASWNDDDDLARIKAVIPYWFNAQNSGSISLELSNSDSVRVFVFNPVTQTAEVISDGETIVGPTSVVDWMPDNAEQTISLLGGYSVNLWVEGLKADPDFEFAVVYKNSEGVELSRDSVHMTISEWTFRGQSGSEVSSVLPVWKESLLAATRRGFEIGNDVEKSLYKIELDGLSPGLVQELKVTSLTNSSDSYIEEFDTSYTSKTVSKNFAVLYSAAHIYAADEDPSATATERDLIKDKLGLNLVHNDGAEITLKTGALGNQFADMNNRRMKVPDRFAKIWLKHDVIDAGQTLKGIVSVKNIHPMQRIKVTLSDGRELSAGMGESNLSFEYTMPISGYFAVTASVISTSWFEDVKSSSSFVRVLPAAATANIWSMKAWDKLRVDKVVPGFPVNRNRRITELYGEIYNSNPVVFKWAGMAALASYMLGDAMAQAESWVKFGDPQVAPDPKTGLDLLAMGNIDVYMDMYPQMLAYKEGGIAAIRQMLLGDPNRLSQLNAWEKIEQGRVENDQQLVWNGNEELLKFEQEMTIQNGAYAANLPYWRELTNHWNGLVPSMPSPIPGDNSTFQSFNAHTIDNWQTIDYGSIASFNDRWRWIIQKQLPAYKIWSDANQIVDVKKLLNGEYKKR